MTRTANPRNLETDAAMPVGGERVKAFTVLLVVPTLHSGAADRGAADMARILRRAGHEVIVASRGGQLAPPLGALGVKCCDMRVGSRNPFIMFLCARRLSALVRERHCDVVHAFGRASAWVAAYAARRNRVPFVTSWFKGFREQNIFKRIYNGIMARGDRVIATSDQLADLINDRYGTPWSRLLVIPTPIDGALFDPESVTPDEIAEQRRAWGVNARCRVILAPGRMARRKGHHLLVEAALRLKSLGVTDFVCIVSGEDQGKTSYTGDLWDLIEATGTHDVVRLARGTARVQVAYAAADIVVSAATQIEGAPRGILEAQAMARPVVASDLSAGPDAILAPPAVAEDRITGLRFLAGDGAALTDAFQKLLALPEAARRGIGERGRDWVLSHYDETTIAGDALRMYVEVVGRSRAAASNGTGP